jgi:glucosyl-3-phosphoglycerate synthase
MMAATEVARCLFVEIIREAAPRAANSLLRQVCDRYRSNATEWVQRYEHVAQLNGLEFHRAEELCAVEMFNDAIHDISGDWNAAATQRHPLLTPPAEILASNPALVESVKALGV